MSAMVRNDSDASMHEIIEAGRIETHFQPITSIKRRRVVAIEALARGRSATGDLVSPGALFTWAERNGHLVELDRLCRRRALEAFAHALTVYPELHLFMNFESAVLDEGVGGSGALARIVAEVGVPPDRVVLEINESRVRDSANLVRFVDRHRELGFLIAIDDLGVGDSNLPRIPALRPDVLKLDRLLVAGIKGNYHREETFRAIVRLGRKLGALIVAEGVETDVEAITSLELGADLLQGFLIARPHVAASLGVSGAQSVTELLARQWRARAVANMRSRQEESSRHRDLLLEVKARLSRVRTPDDFDRELTASLRGKDELECLFVLDAEGSQSSLTVLHEKLTSLRFRGALFSPAPRGTDHSAKDYFYGLMDAGLSLFVTEPYLSAATGNQCRTWSCTFSAMNRTWVLCMDVRV